MNENYVDFVRESLYRDENQQIMPRSPKKIVFAASEYKSESVFSSPKPKKHKKAAYPETKLERRKRTIASVSSDEYFQPKSKLPCKSEKRKQPSRLKKHWIEPKDLFDDDDRARPDMSPSKSETSFQAITSPKSKAHVPRDIKKEYQVPESDEMVSSGSSNEDSQSFTLSDFFDVCEHSLNESITEAHSGIDYEFTSKGLENAEISNSRIFDSCKDEAQSFSEELDEETQSGDESDTKVQSEPNQESMETEEESPAPSEDDSALSEDDLAPSEETSNISAGTDDVPSRNHPHTDKIAETFEIGDEILVVMREQEIVHFFGLFRLKVLLGNIEILGCVLDENSKEINLYSPRGSSLLTIRNLTTNGRAGNILETLPNLVGTDALKKVYVDSTTAVFVCKKIDDPKITFLEKHIAQQIFPKADKTESSRVVFNPKGDWNIVTVDSHWDKILETVTPSTKLFVTGGKGVGKSTFIRYALNRLLKVHEKIRIVDLDPGQSEFTVPGCISYLTVTEPILGPNYSHLKQTERSYLCDINIRDDVDRYLRDVKLLMEEIDASDNLPTIINYIGFTTGIGLNVVSSAITHIRPTDIVQIDSDSHKRNFKSALSLATVKENCDLYGARVAPDLDYRLHRTRAMTDDNGGWTLQPRQVREMCVLAYMGAMMSEQVQSLTDWRLPMYQISLSSIDIADSSGAPLHPAAVNASLVALCGERSRENPFACLGYGVVRGVDLSDAYLVLSTPLEPEALEEVRHLVGAFGVALPPSIYMTPDGVVDHVLYVRRGELDSLSQITKRSYLPANKK